MQGVGGKISEDANTEHANGAFLVCLELKFSMNKEVKAKFSSREWFRFWKVRPGAEPSIRERENSENLAPAAEKRKSWSDCAAVFVLRQLLGKECVAYILARAPASPPTPALTVSAAESTRPRSKHNKDRKHPEHMALIYRYFLLGGRVMVW